LVAAGLWEGSAGSFLQDGGAGARPQPFWPRGGGLWGKWFKIAPKEGREGSPGPPRGRRPLPAEKPEKRRQIFPKPWG